MPSRLTRRRFARSVAAAAAGAMPLAAAAQQPAPAPLPRPADLALQLVVTQYPDGLQPQHLAEIRAEIERQRARSRQLLAVPLTNADEPAPVFAAWRAQG